jgi:hypothetical protein
MTQSSGVSLAASTDIFRPLILRLGIVSLPSPVNDAAYGGNTFWYRLAPTGPNASYAQNERDPF